MGRQPCGGLGGWVWVILVGLWGGGGVLYLQDGVKYFVWIYCIDITEVVL
jgi:hypothetical protein